LYGVNGI